MLPIQYPIIQAPMAGGIISPAFTAAVSQHGMLGSIAAGGLTIDQLAHQIDEVKKRTTQSYQVNIFANPEPDFNSNDFENVNEQLNRIRRALNISEQPLNYTPGPAITEYVDVCIDKGVPIVSFTFGCPAEEIDRLRHAGIIVMGTITNVEEALLFQHAGAHVIIAQGYEAGGHQGGFLNKDSIGLMSLIPQVADTVDIPVIAAGGIRDKRGIQAARLLGADYAQLGTRFLMTEESIAHPLHKAAILKADETETQLTNAFSGKWARGIDNEMIRIFQNSAIPPYPVMNQMTADIRAAAKEQLNPNYLSNWSGQNINDITILSLQQLLAELLEIPSN